MLPSHQQKLDATGARHGQRFGDGDLAREAVTRPPKKNEGWNSDQVVPAGNLDLKSNIQVFGKRPRHAIVYATQGGQKNQARL